MHSKGVVDQDIHLGNMLCTADERVWKKSDLGNCARTTLNGQPNVILTQDCK